MKMSEISKIAEEKGVYAAGMDKTKMIRAIQKKEGYSECFMTAKIRECDRLDCLWRGDCIKFLSLRTSSQYLN